MESQSHAQLPQEYVNLVWLGLFDTVRLHRYYSRMASRFKFRDRIVTVVILLGSSGATGTLLAHLWTELAAALGVVVAVAAIWSLLARYAEKGALASVIAVQCGDQAEDWKQLWFEVSGLTPGEVLERVRQLQSKMDLATANGVDMKDDKLNEQCAEEANNANWMELGGREAQAVPTSAS